MKNITLLGLFIIGFNIVFSQTLDERKIIVSSYDSLSITKLKSENKAQQDLFNQQKRRYSDVPEIILHENGTFSELIGFIDSKIPIYNSINNLNASISTRANTLNTGGLLGLQLDGQNMIAGIWDGGPTRITHQEFDTRASSDDGNTNLNGNSSHATHVVGTVGASGVESDAKGMAPMAQLKTFDWTNDQSEMIDMASQGLLFSNHSYGVNPASVPTWFIGAYSSRAGQWDAIARTFPYYLIVSAGGNSGNFNNPDATTPGFDKLTGEKNAKNNLVVANAQDAQIDSNGNLISVNINSGSSQGPTDDNRVKPDITGNGTSVYSSSSFSDSSYTSFSGTSMASPNVMGTLLLLQQYHNQLYQRYMKSSTVKALTCHTADDVGNVGPDAIYGWGLMNGKKAAETIRDNGIASLISEEEIKQDSIYTKNVKSIAGSPLKATICWTDLAGQINTGTLNDPTPVLVQDLDIRISNANNTYFPWRLDSNANLPALRDGDNAVDNVEQVLIDSADGGDYIITVSHKGQLVDAKQQFSIIITGITSDFTMIPVDNFLTTCSGDTLTFDLEFKTESNNPVQFSAINLPEDVVASFSDNNLTQSESITITLSNFNNVAFGDYEFLVLMSDGVVSNELKLYFRVYQESFENVVLIFPENNADGISTNLLFEWEADDNAKNYRIQISTSPSFDNLLIDEVTSESSFYVDALNEDSIYYWRVLPSNDCNESENYNFYTFRTGTIDCGFTYNATDYSDGLIGNTAFSTASVPIVVNDTFYINFIKAFVEIEHTYVGDMTISLKGPDSINNTQVIMINEICGSGDDVDVSISDNGVIAVCGSNPAIEGHIKSFSNLSVFNNQSSVGTWTLRVLDSYNQDGGQINNFSLEFCKIELNENNQTFSKDTIIANLNSTKIINQLELLASTINETHHQQVYTLLSLPNKGVLQLNNNNLSFGDTFTQEDIQLQSLTYTNTLTEEDEDEFILTVSNNSSGWHPSETIYIKIFDVLSNEKAEITTQFWYPNPVTDFVYYNSNGNQLPNNVEIYDLSGRLIQQHSLRNNQFEINFSAFSKGVYVIKTIFDDHSTIQKIIKK